MLDILEKLKEKLTNFRGDVSGENLEHLDILHEQIKRNQHLKEMAQSEGGKMLINDVLNYLEALDKEIDLFSHDERTLNRLLERRRAWKILVNTLLNAEHYLTLTKEQIEYQLSNE